MSDRLSADLILNRAVSGVGATRGLGHFPLPGIEAKWPLPGQPPAPEPLQLVPTGRQRTKIWEFGTNLHCSIIGTCLSTGELRQVLGKLNLKDVATASEHDVHASGVLVAGKHQDGAKLLHKALDRRHRAAINRFDKTKTVDEVRALWRDAVQSGDIPGAYWAALTHPATNDALAREIFTEVHMLSHLVGAANRADIRRLRQLETENSELEDKVARQQHQLRDALVSRDVRIRELQHALEARIASDHVVPSAAATTAAEAAAWESIAADLKLRLSRSETRRDGVERQLAEMRAALQQEREAREAAERRERELLKEVEAVEASLGASEENSPAPDGRQSAGLTLLYVGGRPGQIGHLRAAAERQGAVLLYHDGGIEERGGLLPGLVSRADAVLFPVDCISHAAMLHLKRLCRQSGKSFVPLRSGGLAPFYAALQEVALPALEG
jgi:hypothetical protein